MILFKIALFICLAVLFILISAYVETHKDLRWYKNEFNKQPRAPYRLVPKNSWQQRVVNILLLRKPVSIKRPMRYSEVRRDLIPNRVI